MLLEKNDNLIENTGILMEIKNMFMGYTDKIMEYKDKFMEREKYNYEKKLKKCFSISAAQYYIDNIEELKECIDNIKTYKSPQDIPV
jgi:hypothetical protein